MWNNHAHKSSHFIYIALYWLSCFGGIHVLLYRFEALFLKKAQKRNERKCGITEVCGNLQAVHETMQAILHRVYLNSFSLSDVTSAGTFKKCSRAKRPQKYNMMGGHQICQKVAWRRALQRLSEVCVCVCMCALIPIGGCAVLWLLSCMSVCLRVCVCVCVCVCTWVFLYVCELLCAWPYFYACVCVIFPLFVCECMCITMRCYVAHLSMSMCMLASVCANGWYLRIAYDLQLWSACFLSQKVMIASHTFPTGM